MLATKSFDEHTKSKSSSKLFMKYTCRFPLLVMLATYCVGCSTPAPKQSGSRLESSIRHSNTAGIKRHGYQFQVEKDGDDLVVNDAIATNFGGVGDYQDNGETEGGIHLRKDGKDVLVNGCSLPMKGYTEQHYSGADTSSSPIPALPYRSTKVIISYQGKSITVPLIERGPGPNSPSHAAIDLTFKTFMVFAPLKQGMLNGVSFRIIGAAKYLKEIYIPPDARTL